jgi:hypothetical protein
MSDTEVDTQDVDDGDPGVPTDPSPPFADVPKDEIIDTEDLESLDEIHAAAAHNRAAMGPAAGDATVVSSGTEFPVPPGPGPEDNVELDNATNGALSAAAETNAETTPHVEHYRADDGGFDPGEHTVAEVQDYLEEHPDEAEAVLAAEADGKGRSSLIG